VVKLGRRAGDAAPISVIELVTPSADGGKTKKKTVKAKAALPFKETVAEKAAVEEKGADTATEAMPVEEEDRKEAEPEEKSEEQAGDQPVSEAATQQAETESVEGEKEAPEQSAEDPLSETEKK
jgi:large subunit ribosomal protein L17